MINIFKKISKNLISENKFRNYFLYATGEIFLVVIGILIAIQINNWNDLRNSKKQITNHIESLKNEISINIKKNEHFINSYNKSLNQTIKYIRLFSDSSEKIQDDSIIKMYSSMIPINGRILSTTAYLDLNKSKILNNISNDTLRKMIIHYGILLEEDKKKNLEFSEGWNQYLFPYFLNNANLIFTEDSIYNLSKSIQSINSDAFIGNIKFINLLILRKGFTHHYIRMFEYENAFSEKLINRINTFLKNKG